MARPTRRQSRPRPPPDRIESVLPRALRPGIPVLRSCAGPAACPWDQVPTARASARSGGGKPLLRGMPWHGAQRRRRRRAVAETQDASRRPARAPALRGRSPMTARTGLFCRPGAVRSALRCERTAWAAWLPHADKTGTGCRLRAIPDGNHRAGRGPGPAGCARHGDGAEPPNQVAARPGLRGNAPMHVHARLRRNRVPQVGRAPAPPARA
jgi:hypothetical protein